MAWTINEIYTNADGSIQFIELLATGSGDNVLEGLTITSAQTGAGSEIFTIPNPDGISGDTTNKTLLLATQGFANLGLVTPDFIIPSNFLPIFDVPPGPGGDDGIGGTLSVFGVDTLAYLSLPKDGTLSIDGTGVLQINSPTNFAGDTDQIPGPNVIDGTPAADNLAGTPSPDVILGRAGNDTLDGGAGNDTMRGQAGDDQYVVSNAGDKVIENSNAGTDIVLSSLDYTLGYNIENLTLTGSAVTGTGNTLDNVINGNDGNNVLLGSDGNDTLMGGLGNDTMNGSIGNDYLDGGDGNNSVVGGDGNDLMFGGSGNDFLESNFGDDSIRGGAGNDTLRGGDGLDTLRSGGGNDSVIAGPGNDLVYSALGDDVLRGVVGDDTIRGGFGNDTLYGGEGNDTVYGGPENDVLFGGLGDDFLAGLLNNDTMTGAGGNDRFWFNALGAVDADTIMDFVVGVDLILLDPGIFTALAAQNGNLLNAANFVSGPAAEALDVDDYIVYDTSTGNLYYDANGDAGLPGELVATLSTLPALAASDILILA